VRLRVLLVGFVLSGRVFAAEPPAGAAPAATAPAPGAPDVDPKLEQAKARYEQGVEAYAAGRFKDAVDFFLDADRISPSAPLSFNIARAYEKLGDDSGALRWYRDYLRRSPGAPNAKAVEELVLRFESRLARKGVQQITVISVPAGATVAVDKTPVGVTPWTGDLVPGRHQVELTLRGYSDATNEIEVLRERAQDVSFELVEAPAPPPESGTAVLPAVAPPAPLTGAPPAEKPAPASFGVWPWVTLGAGGAALGGALAFEFMRRSAEQAAEDETTQIGYKEELDRMESRRTTARVLAGVGGALVIAGGTLLVIDLNRSKSPPKTALSWSASASPDAVQAALSGRF
jgi:tetratricopeptide (TPR) repeat protein